MQNTAEIKNRKRSVAETAQITKAMEMISISKLNKISSVLKANTDYVEAVRNEIKAVLSHTDKETVHPYLNRAYGKKIVYVVILGDRGLVGDYNQLVLKAAQKAFESGEKVYVVGAVAEEYCQSKGISADMRFVNFGKAPTLDTARTMTAYLLELYDKGVADSVQFIYTARTKKSVAEVVTRRFVPLLVEDFDDVTERAGKYVFSYEPSAESVLNILVPQYLLGMVYSALVQAVSSEHLLRVRAMHSATQNAEELIAELNLQYNKVRQSAITTELTELSAVNSADKKSGK